MSNKDKVRFVLEMVLGDYFMVLAEGEDVQEEDLQVFAEGCQLIGKQFDIDITSLDIEGLVAHYGKGGDK